MPTSLFSSLAWQVCGNWIQWVLPSPKTFLTGFLWQTWNSHEFELHFNKSFFFEANVNILNQKKSSKENIPCVFNFRENYPLQNMESYYFSAYWKFPGKKMQRNYKIACSPEESQLETCDSSNQTIICIISGDLKILCTVGTVDN